MAGLKGRRYERRTAETPFWRMALRGKAASSPPSPTETVGDGFGMTTQTRNADLRARRYKGRDKRRRLAQGEDNLHCSIDLHGLPVERRRPVFPFLHGVHRGCHQQGRSRNEFELLDRAVLGNDRVQDDRARNVSGLGNRRVFRRHFLDERRGLDGTTYLDSAWRRGFWRRRRRSCRADSSYHIAGSSGHSADIGRGDGRRRFVLRDFNFLRDHGGRHCRANRESFRLHLLFHYDLRRWRWWGRWRRRYEEGA